MILGGNKTMAGMADGYSNPEINEAVALKLGYSSEEASTGEGYDFSDSIEAAWEVIEKIRQTELVALCWHDGAWHCEVNCVDGERPIDEEADTAPLAICKAFLKLP